MQEFSKNRSSRFIARRPALIAACAIVLVGGGAFAAAGGINLIKRFFVTVDIAGQPVQLELQPVGDNTQEGTLDTQLADGRQAKIHVQRVDRVDADTNEHKMQVRVNLTGEDGQSEAFNDMEITRGDGPGQSEQTYTVADLGDAEPAHQWVNAQGESRAVYLIEDEDSGKIRVFTTKSQPDGTTVVRMAAQLPAGRGFDTSPEAATDDSGMVTLTWDDGGGDHVNKRVIKLMDRTSVDPNAPIVADTPEGRIEIKVGEHGGGQ